MKFLEPSFYTVRLPLRINAIHFNITYSCVSNYKYKGGIFVVFPTNTYSKHKLPFEAQSLTIIFYNCTD